MPNTLSWVWGASFSGEKRDSGRRRPALMLSRTLFVLGVSTVVEEGGATHHSTVMKLIALPPLLAISFCIFVAAKPPPTPPRALVVPRMTCVTERRPSAIECLAPWVASMCLSLWSETRGAVEPLM
jgi:hypothetical protein